MKVETGCRDCRKCTNSIASNFGRNSGRLLAGVASAGLSEVGLGLRKKCRICGHQLSLHEGSNAATPQPAIEFRQPDLEVPRTSAAEISPSPSVSPSATLPDKLFSLAELHKNGLITDEQFTTLRDQLFATGQLTVAQHGGRGSGKKPLAKNRLTRPTLSEDTLACLRMGCQGFVIQSSKYCWSHSSSAQRSEARTLVGDDLCIASQRDGSPCAVRPRDGGPLCAKHRSG